MSYLDFPRLHFSGLLYNYPNTINNATKNFDPATRLTDGTGAYVYDVVSWAPLGSGRIYFQDCVVRGATDSWGRWIPSGDPLIGADLNTPSPFTPIPDGKDGTYDTPKMVNLDPDWDDRTEFYGMRLQVALPSGATFGGEMSVPQVREMSYDRFALNQSQKTAIRPCQQAGILLGIIENVQWPGTDAGSPLLQEFMKACGGSIAVEMTMDLCWSRNEAAASIPGRRYLYGRVHGTLGPVRPGEGRQTIFGRRLQQLPALGWSASYAATSKLGSQTFLSIDLGMATPVAVERWDNNIYPDISGVTIVDCAIDVKALVSAVKSRQRLDQAFADANIATLDDPNLQITGGALKVFNNRMLLIFGHSMNGLYTAGGGTMTQTYSSSVRVWEMSAAHDGNAKVKFIVKMDVMVPDHPYGVDPSKDPYHRRDLPVEGAINAQGKERIVAYGGVFVAGKFDGYVNPVYIDAAAAPSFVSLTLDTSTTQLLSQYECAVIPAYSARGKAMYSTFFGGISEFYWKDGALHHDPPNLNIGPPVDGLPFINSISTLKNNYSSGTPVSGQYLHVQQSFPPAAAGQAPQCGGKPAAYLGAETRFVRAGAVPHYITTTKF